MTRIEQAADAYLETFTGPWGLKAAPDDALLSIVKALYPIVGASIDTIRETPLLDAIAGWIHEDLAANGMDEIAITRRVVPILDAYFDWEPTGRVVSLTNGEANLAMSGLSLLLSEAVKPGASDYIAEPSEIRAAIDTIRGRSVDA